MCSSDLSKYPASPHVPIQLKTFSVYFKLLIVRPRRAAAEPTRDATVPGGPRACSLACCLSAPGPGRGRRAKRRAVLLRLGRRNTSTQSKWLGMWCIKKGEIQKVR